MGGVLGGSGTSGLLADDLVLHATNLLLNQPALLFAGTNATNGGAGVVFGDGLRCASGAVRRFGVRVPDVAGTANWGPGLGAQGAFLIGDTQRFQAWYRNTNGSPCGTDFNLSNGYAVAFVY